MLSGNLRETRKNLEKIKFSFFPNFSFFSEAEKRPLDEILNKPLFLESKNVQFWGRLLHFFWIFSKFIKNPQQIC